ncbi:hypothetical protein EK0264_10345 [Epidermidibacterium keratini]|uniref:Enoyl-CoA hydratase/isomerase family protein n=1 Tax=Epidermidibacterium keratini TaxID=1891644 RepID=A0A7L4YNJ9_9ACTN|nr:enoyl-CoA hydratase/isomerase family protein [Epidermidibacterium keratini]QHC00648.1 hypothetical protein EK0264_10345 [Epidermidibacterium keratini]
MSSPDASASSGAGVRWSRSAPGVALIEFTRPERRNPLDVETGLRLVEILAEIEADESVRAVVITGRGGAFSAGGDIDHIARIPSRPEAETAASFATRFAVSEAIYNSAKAYIAAISGPVVGAAFGLALACDLRIGDETAMFLAPFSRMGLVPDYGLSWLLPRTVGTSAALEVALLGDRIGALDAHRLGVLNRVVDDPLAAALGAAGVLASRPAYGIAETKRLAHAAMDRPFSEGLADEVAAQARGFQQPEVQSEVAAYTQSIGNRAKTKRGA